MKHKKIILLLILSLSLFVGCESKDTTTDTTDTTDKKSQSSESVKTVKTYENLINNYQPPFYMAKLGDDFYYCNSEKPGIFKLSKDSSNWTKLNDEKASYLNIYNDKLYYIDSSFNLIKTDLDGISNKQKIHSNVKEIIIKDDILLCSVSSKELNRDGFLDFSLTEIDLKNDMIINSKPVCDRTFNLIDKDRYIYGSRSLFNYIFINEEIVFPTDEESNIITPIGATENELVFKTSNFSPTAFYSVTNDGVLNTLQLPETGEYLVVDDKVFYYSDYEFGYVPLDGSEGKTPIFKHPKIKYMVIFNFDKIIYSLTPDGLTPMYDVSQNKPLGEFKDLPVPAPEKPAPPEPSVEEDTTSEVDKAIDLILQADGNKISKEKALGGSLIHLDNFSSSQCKTLARTWTIPLTGTCYSFELSDSGETMINQYIVDMATKKVYLIPSQGPMPAYLMENNAKIKEFSSTAQ